jgi:hypothetical protein
MQRIHKAACSTRGLLILAAFGFALVSYGLYDYKVDEMFRENAIHTLGTIRTVEDEPFKTGGSALSLRSLNTNHLCRYTITFQPNAESSQISTELRLIADHCAMRGETLAILFDPGNPKNVWRDTLSNPLPLDNVFVWFGVMLLGSTCFGWIYRTRS